MMKKQTSLDLNGPILSFTQQPISTSTCFGDSAVFSGIATARFPTQTPPNPATNTGTILYKWYDENGPLNDSSTIIGSGTTTLTLLNNTTNRRVRLTADYIPSAYSQPSGSPVTSVTARFTGNAVNDILTTNTVSLTVNPLITITSQPVSVEVAPQINAIFSTSATITDNTELSYQWQINQNNLTDGTFGNFLVSGSRTPTLNISSTTFQSETNTIRCRVSSATACNSPLFTNSVNFNIILSRPVLNSETFNEDGGTVSKSSTNLTSGSVRFESEPGNSIKTVVFYPSEQDIPVTITLAGAAGEGRGGRSGEGGLSVFRYTLRRNTEYVLKFSTVTGSSSSAGGGGAFLYEKARLIAICGGGGGAGSSGSGGFGGGINVAGQSGTGSGAGVGARVFSAGTLPSSTGEDPNANIGGRVSGCTIGTYYRSIGFSACQDVGLERWRTSSGQVLSDTALIQRGYKSGLGYRNNGGGAQGSDGGGGSGAVGGNGAIGGNGSGGGGGSGYTDGSIDLIGTQLGGNTSSRGFLLIELN
jgi:hypothetical protein